jgi:hypothetical protein
MHDLALSRGQVSVLSRECKGLGLTLDSFKKALSVTWEPKAMQRHLTASIRAATDLERKVSH